MENSNFDFKSALKEFGATDEQLAQLEKGELKTADFTAATIANISNVQKERYLTEWDKEKKSALEKETQTGTYNSIKKKMFDALKDLGITDDKFKDAKFEDILQEIPKRINESKAQYEERLKKAGADVENIAKLQSQLEQMQTLAKEHEELKGKQATLKDEARLEVANEYFIEKLQETAFKCIENIAPNIKFPLFQSYIDKMGITIDVTDHKEGKYVIKDHLGRVIPKQNPQFTYTDLKEFYADIAKKEGLVTLTDAAQKEGEKPNLDNKNPVIVKTQSW